VRISSSSQASLLAAGKPSQFSSAKSRQRTRSSFALFKCTSLLAGLPVFIPLSFFLSSPPLDTEGISPGSDQSAKDKSFDESAVGCPVGAAVGVRIMCSHRVTEYVRVVINDGGLFDTPAPLAYGQGPGD
jgi:hypothetical protein